MNITTRSKLQSQMIEIVHILVQMMKEHTETILPCGRFSQRHFTAEKQTQMNIYHFSLNHVQYDAKSPKTKVVLSIEISQVKTFYQLPACIV